MTKIIIAIFAVVFSAHCADAQLVWESKDWSLTAILPPLEFDHPYSGDLVVKRVKTEDDVRAACKVNPPRALACSLRWPGRCEVYITPDALLASVGLTYELTFRHELGHCNGWSGHAGARYLAQDKKQYPYPFVIFPK